MGCRAMMCVALLYALPIQAAETDVLEQGLEESQGAKQPWVPEDDSKEIKRDVELSPIRAGSRRRNAIIWHCTLRGTICRLTMGTPSATIAFGGSRIGAWLQVPLRLQSRRWDCLPTLPGWATKMVL